MQVGVGFAHHIEPVRGFVCSALSLKKCPKYCLDKAQRLKDVKEASRVHDNMRALGAQLLEGDCLARLVGKSSPGLCVGK